MGRTVRAAQSSEIAHCAAVLAEAFADDPLMTYIWPDGNQRTRLLPKYFDASIRFHHIHGGGVEVATDDEHIVGVAVWDPPGHWRQPVGRTVRASPFLLAALRDRLLAAIRVRRELDLHHPNEPQWYLANIGTGAQVRGDGYGSALLRARLANCDVNRLPAYLVCTHEANIPYYAAFGFTVTTEFALPNGGPPLWSMWRSVP